MKHRPVTEYRIVVHEIALPSGTYINAMNPDFEIEVREKLTHYSDAERALQTSLAILKVRDGIQERLQALAAKGKTAAPPPLYAQGLIHPRTLDHIPLQEACRLLGEPAHTVRRMADEGILTVTRTRKGHRRFSRTEIESLKTRDASSPS